MAISKLGVRRQVVIPKEICDELGLQVGDYIEVVKSSGNEITIKPKRLVDAEDTITPAEEKSVARGFEQLKKGEFKSWETVKDELGL